MSSKHWTEAILSACGGMCGVNGHRMRARPKASQKDRMDCARANAPGTGRSVHCETEILPKGQWAFNVQQCSEDVLRGPKGSAGKRSRDTEGPESGRRHRSCGHWMVETSDCLTNAGPATRPPHKPS